MVNFSNAYTGFYKIIIFPCQICGKIFFSAAIRKAFSIAFFLAFYSFCLKNVSKACSKIRPDEKIAVISENEMAVF